MLQTRSCPAFFFFIIIILRVITNNLENSYARDLVPNIYLAMRQIFPF